jgi:hypothetical protein
MPWANNRPRQRKYDAAHNRARAQHMARLRAVGMAYCAEPHCVMDSRIITPDMDLHLSHDPTGTRILGLSHAACNRAEAAKRARKYQDSSRLAW